MSSQQTSEVRMKMLFMVLTLTLSVSSFAGRVAAQKDALVTDTATVTVTKAPVKIIEDNPTRKQCEDWKIGGGASASSNALCQKLYGISW